MDKQLKDIVFSVSSGFGARKRKPYVQVLVESEDWMTQMPPAKAMELAANLLQAAEAAEGDGFLMYFIQDVIGVPEVEKQAQLLVHFREYRERQRNENTGRDQPPSAETGADV